MKRRFLPYFVLVATLICIGVASAAEEAQPAKEFTIHLIGDSTMAPKDLSKGSPERGWGMMFPNFLDRSVEVKNYACNGRSTKSFKDLGHWAEVEKNLKAGDYLFIQFGHNDSKKDDPQRYAECWTDYQTNLREYISIARAKGVTPVLLTPCSRRWFKDGKLDRTCLGEYPESMRQVARDENVILLEITEPSMDWLESLGDEASRAYYMNIAPYTCAAFPEGKNDNTHTNARGARAITKIVCEAIRAQLPQIAAHLTYYDFVVAKDGCGDFATVQEAIDACPDYSHNYITRILIRKGVYNEMVTIPHNKFRLHIEGESAEDVKIVWSKYAKQLWPDSDRTVGTSGSAAFYIHSSYVTLENLTLANECGEGKDIAQGVTLFTNGDYLFFHNCRILGNQDTIYTYGRYGKEGGICRNYFLDCYIEGTTDYIFGPSIAYFENCELHCKKNSYITAASTFQGQKYGYVFHKCRITAAEGVDRMYLGRPWRPYANTVFIECEMGGFIHPDGWKDWPREKYPDGIGTAFYAEYRSKGPGASPETRVKWSTQLTKKQAAEYTFEKVMAQPADEKPWNPFNNQ